ncbi:MAG: hypothetical protein AAF703_03785 [Cyanobacteria bacterium P01_D01_bin.105]
MVLYSSMLSVARSREWIGRILSSSRVSNSHVCQNTHAWNTHAWKWGLACGAAAMTLGLSHVAIAQNYTALSEPELSEPELSEPELSEPELSETNRSRLSPAGPKTEQAPTEQTQQIAQTYVSQSQSNLSIAAITPPDLPSPAPSPFSPNVTGIVDLANGAASIHSLGQLRPTDVQARVADDVSWLSDVILPLYVAPGGAHWGWIYQGWLIPEGQTYLAIGRDAGFAMVKAYENLYTFPVLEARADGWFRVQYSPNGSAWAHSSHLELGDVSLAVEGWETRLQSQNSVFFLDSSRVQPLRSQPEAATNMLSMIPAGSLIEPLDFQGDWMQVRVTRPASECRALAGATVSEGWMRWRGESRESLIWYRPGESCS